MMRDTDDVSDWSSLPADLLVIIASFLTMIEDFMSFRGVCTDWRAAAPKDKFVPINCQVPFLMLSEEEGSDEREFYSLFKNTICARIPLPDARGKRCMDVGFGWILTWADSGEVCLLKPFSNARIQLPNFKTFPDYRKHRCNPPSSFICRAWIVDDPSEVSALTLLVLVKRNVLGLWSDGDEDWTKINHRVRSPVLTCVDGEIIILDLKGNLMIWHPLETDLRNPKERQLIKVDGAPTSCTDSLRDYLLCSEEDTLLVRRNTAKFLAAGTGHFTVMRLNLSFEDVYAVFVEIEDIGKYCIFLGDNTTVAIDATQFPGVLKPNCIYFTDDCIGSKNRPKGGGKDMGIYNIGDRSIEGFEVESYNHMSSPLWMFPSF